MIEVYAYRKNTRLAAALVERLREEGRQARESNARFFDPKQVDRGAVLVYHDGDNPAVPARYAELGIPCEIMPGLEPERGVESYTGPVLSPDVTEPVAEEPEHSPDPGQSYRVEQSGTWYKLIGPDGEQVGKAQRSEGEAWAQRGAA